MAYRKDLKIIEKKKRERERERESTAKACAQCF